MHGRPRSRLWLGATLVLPLLVLGAGLWMEFGGMIEARRAEEQAQATAQLELVATLASPADRIGTRTLRISEPRGGANAAQGVAAMKRAVARAVAELARWIESVSTCRG